MTSHVSSIGSCDETETVRSGYYLEHAHSKKLCDNRGVVEQPSRASLEQQQEVQSSTIEIQSCFQLEAFASYHRWSISRRKDALRLWFEHLLWLYFLSLEHPFLCISLLICTLSIVVLYFDFGMAHAFIYYVYFSLCTFLTFMDNATLYMWLVQHTSIVSLDYANSNIYWLLGKYVTVLCTTL